MNTTAKLLLHCPDRPGILAEITNFITINGGNIVYIDQFVDRMENVFFGRIEWELEGFMIPRDKILDYFNTLYVKKYNMDLRLYFSDAKPRMAIFVSKMSHCLYDMLARYTAGEWDVEIPIIISNHPDMQPAAERFGIPYRVFPITKENKLEQEQAEMELLRELNVDFIVLARYMQVISERMIEEYPNRMMPEQIVAYETAAPNFSYTADDLMAYFEDKKIWSLVLINPDNPTGNYIPYADCLRLAEWCQQRNIIFILDESFIDFSTEHSTFITNKILEQYSNLVVIKSISKSYGVPGLRLGILATSNAMLMTNLRRAVSIWNINSFAEFFLQILGKYERPYQQAMTDFRAERERFVEELQAIEYLRVIPSEANYLLCEVLPPHTPRELAIQLLKQHNILIKDCTSKCHAPYIRIAVRDTDDNKQLIAALRTL